MNKTIYNTDISGLANINDFYESSLIKNWIKLISTDKTIPFQEYNRKEHFILIADIVLCLNVPYVEFSSMYNNTMEKDLI